MTEARGEARGSGAWRVLMWPVGPAMVVGRSSLRPRAAGVLQAAQLPAPVKELIANVVRRTRLWQGEQADVARELVVHFEDALAAGADAHAAVRDFGDPVRAARLIRRAKRRARGLLWLAWMRAWQTALLLLGLLLVVYLVLLTRFYAATPDITRNFAAELSTPILATAEQDRAWPLYRKAYLALEPRPEGLTRRVAPGRRARPGDPGWAEVPAYLERQREALALARRAAARPVLGYPLTNVPDPEVFGQGLIQAGHDRETVLERARTYAAEDRPVHWELLDLHAIGALAQLLTADARQAAEEGDAHRAAANIQALTGMAAHLNEVPLLLGSQYSLTVLTGIAHALGDLIHLHPELFSEDQLRDLAHVLGTSRGFDILDSAHKALRGEKAAIEDVIQRIYSDDGRGGGRLTPAGVELLRSLTWQPDAEPLDFALERSALHPVLGAVVADRAETTAELNRVFAMLESELAAPPWEWQELPGASILNHPDFERWRLRFPVLATMLPNIGRFTERAHQSALMRDAVTVATALELHRRRHGEYPESLEQLTPALLPRIPVDPFDGQPIRYRFDREAGPILYVLGADRSDNGGISPPADVLLRDSRRFGRPHGLTSLADDERLVPLEGDWVLWPSRD